MNCHLWTWVAVYANDYWGTQNHRSGVKTILLDEHIPRRAQIFYGKPIQVAQSHWDSGGSTNTSSAPSQRSSHSTGVFGLTNSHPRSSALHRVSFLSRSARNSTSVGGGASISNLVGSRSPRERARAVASFSGSVL